MKLFLKNPATMKNIHREPDFYFSAYPLKALNLPEDEKKTYLKIYSGTDKCKKRSVNSKILPMVNPYPDYKLTKSKEIKNKSTDQIEERETDWFASYE